MTGRQDRERNRSLGQAADLWAPGTPVDSHRQLVQVYDGGSLPTAAPKVYLTRPAWIDFDEAEGSTWSTSVDPDATIPVVVLGGAPAAGDHLIAHAVGGRWVAEMGQGAGPSTCIATVRAFGCDSILALSVPGVSVGVWTDSGKATSLGSGTTATGGAVDIDVGTAGSYWLELSHARFSTFAGTKAFVCGGETTQGLTPASGYHCLAGLSAYGCPLPLKDTLYASHPVLGTTTLTWSSTNTWTGSGTYSYPGCASGTLCVSPSCPAASVSYTMALSSSGGVITMAIQTSFNTTTFCPGGTGSTVEIYNLYLAVTCDPFTLSIHSSPGTVKKCLYCSATADYTITVTE